MCGILESGRVKEVLEFCELGTSVTKRNVQFLRCIQAGSRQVIVVKLMVVRNKKGWVHGALS